MSEDPLEVYEVLVGSLCAVMDRDEDVLLSLIEGFCVEGDDLRDFVLVALRLITSLGSIVDGSPEAFRRRLLVWMPGTTLGGVPLE
jgi:hypothetical protein